MINYAKPNQKLGFVRYNREFAITVIVITEFDCIVLILWKTKGNYLLVVGEKTSILT